MSPALCNCDSAALVSSCGGSEAGDRQASSRARQQEAEKEAEESETLGAGQRGRRDVGRLVHGEGELKMSLVNLSLLQIIPPNIILNVFYIKAFLVSGIKASPSGLTEKRILLITRWQHFTVVFQMSSCLSVFAGG